MKKRISFGKSVMICVISFFALSAAITGCSTDYGDEIDDLLDRVEILETDVADIKAKIAEGKLVQSVSGTGNTITVTFSNGSSSTITVSGTQGPAGSDGENGKDGTNGTNGADGAPGEKGETGPQGPQGPAGAAATVTIENGLWVINGVSTGKPATSAPSPELITEDDGRKQWYIYVWNETSLSYEPKATNVYAGEGSGGEGEKGDKGDQGEPGADGKDGTVVTIDEEKGVWVLDGDLTDIPAVGPSSPEFDSEGNRWIYYVWDKEDTAYVASYSEPLPEPLQIYVIPELDDDEAIIGWWLYVWVEGTNNPREYEGIYLPKDVSTPTPTPAGSIELLGYTTYNNPYANLSLNKLYASIDNLIIDFWYVTDLTDHEAEELESWTEGTTPVVKKNVLISLKGESKVLVISTNLEPNDLKLSLKDSKGNSLPIAFGKPIKFANLLTKANADPIYYIPFVSSSATYESTTAVDNNFAEKFSGSDEILYYLEDESGAKSNYSSFAIMRGNSDIPADIPTEGFAVEKINEKIATAEVFTVITSQDNKICFDSDEAKYVYDYYITPAEGTTITGFKFDKEDGTFSINRANADCSIDVYKLHITGDTYKETIKLKVVNE